MEAGLSEKVTMLLGSSEEEEDTDDEESDGGLKVEALLGSSLDPSFELAIESYIASAMICLTLVG